MHLRRRLRARRELELDLDPVERVPLPGLLDVGRRHEDARLSGGGGLTEACADLALGAARECRAVHVPGPAGHRRSRVDVLGDRVLQEAVRRHDLHPPGLQIGALHHAEHAAEVVDVAVAEDDGDHRAVAAVLAVEREPRRRGLPRDERVDDDDAVVGLDERHDRQVEPAHLVNALHDLEEPVLGDQPRLPPQARIDGGGRVAVDEVVRRRIPDRVAVAVADHRVGESAEEPAIGVVEVGGVAERQRSQQGGVGIGDRRCRVVLLHGVISSGCARPSAAPLPLRIPRRGGRRQAPICAAGSRHIVVTCASSSTARKPPIGRKPARS